MKRLIFYFSFILSFVSIAFAADRNIDVDNNKATDIAYGGTNATSAANARTNLGLGVSQTPNFAGVDLGTASTTIGVLKLYGNSKAYPFNIFSLGADAPSVGWRWPDTVPSITSLITVDSNGYWAYLDPATLGGFNEAGNYTLTGAWDFTGATVTGLGTATLPPATVGQILQADADGVFQPVSEIAGLINDAGTADDDLWSAAKNITMLAGKQATLVSGTNIKMINSQDITGAGNITISGTFGFDTYPTYEDSPHDSGIAVNATTLAVYSTAASKWLTVGLTDTLNPTPVTYSLTITPAEFTGADKFTYDSTDYTTEQVITGLSADASFTVTPDAGRAIACTGTGLTDNTGGNYTANTDTANVVATCTASASGPVTQTLGPSSTQSNVWVNSGTLANVTDSSDETVHYTYSNDVGQLYKFPTPTACSGTINKITLYSRAVMTGSEPKTTTMRFDSYWSSTHHYGSVSVTSTIAEYSADFATGPTGGKWTPTEISDNSFGLKSWTSTMSNGVNVLNNAKIWMVVTCD